MADRTPPSVPTGLAAAVISSSQINLTWNPSTDNVGVTGYRVRRDGQIIATPATPGYNDTGLSPATTYSYTVSAFDAAGNNSAQSSAVQATTQGSQPPPSLTITAPDPASGTVNVTATATNPGTLKILVDNVVKQTCPGSPCTYVWNTTTATDGPHTLKVNRVDNRGAVLETTSITVTVDNGGPPPPPTGTLFPANSVWNTPIDTAPLHPESYKIASDPAWHGGHLFHADFGTVYQGNLNGIPINYVAGNSVPLKTVQITTYASESDSQGAGVPIPDTVVIEADPGADPNSDRHMLIVDTDNHILHEYYNVDRLAGNQYRAAQYSKWDYQTNGMRPDGWTSSDAAGLPVANLLIQYDEVAAAVTSGGTVPHAFRCTLEFTYSGNPPQYLWPARHYTTSGDNTRPKFGMRFRLKAGYDISNYSPTNQAILRTLKKYGMFLADNGGDWFISGRPDSRWDDNDLHLLQDVIPADALELVDESTWMVDPNSMQAQIPGGGGMSVSDVGTGLNRVVTVESTGLFRLVFEAADNWGLCQWYDLVYDPTASTNLVGPACGSGSPYPCTDITSAEPALFQWVFYGTTPNDPKLYTRSAYYSFPNLPRSFTILEQSGTRVVVEAVSHPCVTAVGTLDNVTGTVRYTIYPDGRIYVKSTLSVDQAQTASSWWNSIMGLEDPGHQGEAPPDSVRWIRASATQNPYTYVAGSEAYIFAYWSPNTPAPYTNFSKASVLLVPRAGNPLQGKQQIHSWSNFVRWGYGMDNLSLPVGGSVVQDYLIQLGTQNSAVLPNINSIAVAGPIASNYQSNPLP